MSRKKKQAAAAARKKKSSPAPSLTQESSGPPSPVEPSEAAGDGSAEATEPTEAADATSDAVVETEPTEAADATSDEATKPTEPPHEREDAPTATLPPDDALPVEESGGDDEGEWPAPPDSVFPPPPDAHDAPDESADGVVSSVAAFRWPDDVEVTVNLTGGLPPLYERDDLAEGGAHDVIIIDSGAPEAGTGDVAETHLRGLVEALVFASDSPVRPAELARRAESTTKEIRRVLAGLRATYLGRGIQLDEVGGAWVFRTNPVYAPFVRELTGQKPVKLTRAQIETLSILAYRQPITRPEIDDIRGVDSGPVLKLLLERDLIKILGKKDEPGRPILYGTTAQFLEFFGIASLKDLPTLREFTELNDDSKRVVERELGEPYEEPHAEANASGDGGDASPDDALGEPEDRTPPEASPDELLGDARVDEALAELERAALANDEDAEETELGDALAATASVEAEADSEADSDDEPLDDGFDFGDDEDDAATDDATTDDDAATDDATTDDDGADDDDTTE